VTLLLAGLCGTAGGVAALFLVRAWERWRRPMRRFRAGETAPLRYPDDYSDSGFINLGGGK
jgi:hypothetical protein